MLKIRIKTWIKRELKANKVSFKKHIKWWLNGIPWSKLGEWQTSNNEIKSAWGSNPDFPKTKSIRIFHFIWTKTHILNYCFDDVAVNVVIVTVAVARGLKRVAEPQGEGRNGSSIWWGNGWIEQIKRRRR